MKMIRVLSLTLAICLLMAGMALAAEPQVYTYDLDTRANLNESSNTLTMQRDGAYVLTDVAGNALTTLPYIHMSEDYDHPVLEVALEEGINVRGIIDASGKELVPCRYGKIEVVNGDWQVGLVLETVTTGEDYDYTSSSDKEVRYLITGVDCYYRGKLVGTLERLQYDDIMYAYGDYLYISGDGFSGYALSEKYGLIHHEKNFYPNNEFYNGLHYGSNQQAFTNTCTLLPSEVKQSVTYDKNGNFVDLQGNVVGDGGSPYKEYASVTYVGEYFVTRADNGKYGVASKNGDEILPAVYDKIAYTSDGNNVFASGYQLVVKDGRVGYVDLQGNEVAGFQYDVDDSVVKGFLYNPNFCCIENMGKVIVITPTAGELPETYDEVGYAYAGQPLLIVTKGEQRGAIDINGNVVIPFGNKRFYVSEDYSIYYSSYDEDSSKYYTCYYFPVEEAAQSDAEDGADVAEGLAGTLAAAMQSNAAAQTEDAAVEEAPAAAEDGSWSCTGCGTANTGKFCTECGTAKPEESAACASCGYELPEGENFKFCPECGSSF